MFRSNIFAVLLLSIPTFGAAEARYDCEIKTYGRGGWTPDEIQFSLSKDRSTARVIDSFIVYSRKKPITVNTSRLKNGVLRFGWTLDLPIRGGGSTPVRYRVDFSEATRKGKMKTEVRVNDIRLNGGRLTCKDL